MSLCKSPELSNNAGSSVKAFANSAIALVDIMACGSAGGYDAYLITQYAGSPVTLTARIYSTIIFSTIYILTPMGQHCTLWFESKFKWRGVVHSCNPPRYHN
jgi:hypothetical protein